MARRIKPKIKYKKNKKTPKALVGAATLALGAGKAIYGGIQARRAKKAEKDFDKSRLETKVTSATQRMADQPIDQSFIEQMQGQQAADRASAMGALAKDPRNALAGVQALEAQAGKQRTDLLGMQQQAKTRAMENLASEQRAVQQNRVGIAQAELEGIRGEKAAATQNIFGGLEDVASGIGAGGLQEIGGLFNREPTTAYGKEGANIKAEKGGKIDSEEGGVTPGDFDHDSNPIDMVQDGEKIGEATGGELILPPNDVEDIRMALQNEDKDAAFDLMKDLVAKYDSNTISADDDSEQMMAQEGTTIPPDAIPKDKAAKIMKYVMRKDYYGSEAAPDYVDIAKEELNLTDKETEFLVKYAESRKKSSKQREQKAFDKRSASGQMGGDMSMGGYLKRMVSKLKK